MAQVSRRSAAFATLLGNGLTVALTVAQAFLLIPLCLRVIDATLYGAWLAASELLIWAQMLDGGLPNLLTQRAGALAGRHDWTGAARWSSTVLALLGGIGAVLLGLALVLAPWIAAVLDVAVVDRNTFVPCLQLGAVASVLLMWANGSIALSRGLQRTGALVGSQVGGAAAGFAVSVALLLAGWGLWSLAVGMLARAVIAAAAACLFLYRLPATAAQVGWWTGPSRVVAREIWMIVPSMSVANVSYVVANNSEVLLVSAMLGPVPALVYALTRRAFDGVRNLLDTIAWAVAGGFAHLVTAPDRHRSRAVLADILSLRFAAASLAVAIVVAVNASFVSLLFGSVHYGGAWLTLAFAMQIMLGGQSFLTNYLWRATGHVREGSIALTAEAVVRMVAMVVGLLAFGLVGAPLAAALVSLAALLLAGRRLTRGLPAADVDAVPMPWRLWIPVAVVALGAVAAWLPLPMSWTTFVMTAISVTFAGGFLLWVALPAPLTRQVLDQWRVGP